MCCDVDAESNLALVRREVSLKAKLYIHESIYIPTITYGHESADTRY